MQPQTIDDYFKDFGKFHVQKATAVLDPLHRPGVDPEPDFSAMHRQPFACQSAAITAAIKMLTATRRGLIVGEMGTGKTIMGMLAIHYHAMQSARKGGRNGRYRAVILCPDHLIKKWRDELIETIPDVITTIFDGGNKGQKIVIKEMVHLYEELRGTKGRWRKPAGAEWYILGRNQAKFLPTRVAKAFARKGIVTEEVLDKDDNKVIQKRVVKLDACPICGMPPLGKDGGPIRVMGSKILTTCRARWHEEIGDPDRHTCGLDRTKPRAPLDDPLDKPGRTGKSADGKEWIIRECGEKFWQYTSKPKRWPPGIFFSQKLHGAFHYLVVDEVHEQKSDEAAQAMACAKLIASIPHTLALTGTLIGGYADHLFPLLFRFSPDKLIEEGFEWGKSLAFTREYGRIEHIEKTTTDPDTGEVVQTTASQSMRKDRVNKNETERPAPGVMPALFGRHLLDKSIFVCLEDMAEGLPPYREFIGCVREDDYSQEDHQYHVDCAITMEDAQKTEYQRVERILVSTCNDMLQHGQMKLLGAMLMTTLEYSDKPWGWRAPTGNPDHLAVGYWEKPNNRSPENWRGVVQPHDLDEKVVYPKEQVIIDLCQREIRGGNQVWLYSTMTGKRDVQPRLQTLLANIGLRVGILRAKAVQPKQRLEWIAKNGPKYDVIISHADLVKTGVDFFGKTPGSYNFNSIVFAQTGYNVFTLRQAGRRAWRIGQTKSCRVSFLHYRQTMQQRAIELVARKMAAAMALDGDLNVEGLCAMADDQSAAMALARSISESINEDDIQRNWSKVRANLPRAEQLPADNAWLKLGLDSIAETPLDGLDFLDMGVALMAKTMLDLDALEATPTLSRDTLLRMAEDLFYVEEAFEPRLVY